MQSINDKHSGQAGSEVLAGPATHSSGTTLSTRRIEAFSDGVLSIVITLLVLQLSIPIVADRAPDAELNQRLVEMAPELLSYVLRFAVVGIFWAGHHSLFDFIVCAGRVFLWVNNLFVRCIGFIPFPAAMLGAYPRRRIAIIIYGGGLALTGLTLALIWMYATHQRRLVDRNLDYRAIRNG